MSERGDQYPNAQHEPRRRVAVVDIVDHYSHLPETELDRLRGWLRRFVALAGRIDDGETCTLDADGDCQTHSGDAPCEIADLRLLVREIGRADG